MTMPTLTEPPWTMAEMKHAISRLKMKKGGDDVRLVAELLKHSPDDFLNALLHVMKEVLTSGNVPSSWQNYTLQNASEDKGSVRVWFLAHCKCTLVVQTLCIPHVGTHGRLT